MSTSFIEYGGHGFWSFDRYTERLIDGVGDLALESATEPWEKELALHWKQQASGAFSAWMHLNLDEFVSDDQRRRRLIELVSRAADKYSSADPVHQTAVLLIELLNGEIKWDASSPLSYMVSDNAAESS